MRTLHQWSCYSHHWIAPTLIYWTRARHRNSRCIKKIKYILFRANYVTYYFLPKIRRVAFLGGLTLEDLRTHWLFHFFQLSALQGGKRPIKGKTRQHFIRLWRNNFAVCLADFEFIDKTGELLIQGVHNPFPPLRIRVWKEHIKTYKNIAMKWKLVNTFEIYFLNYLHFSTLANSENVFPFITENFSFLSLDFWSMSPLIQAGFSSDSENIPTW